LLPTIERANDRAVGRKTAEATKQQGGDFAFESFPRMDFVEKGLAIAQQGEKGVDIVHVAQFCGGLQAAPTGLHTLPSIFPSR
jgi:hypothetical protein